MIQVVIVSSRICHEPRRWHFGLSVAAAPPATSEVGAPTIARDYIRQAREAGHDWDQIGHALGLTQGADQAGTTVAEAAYTYAAGSSYSDTSRRYSRSFVWTCRSCDQLIRDQGLIAGPAKDEQGHTKHCPRLTAAVAERDPEWETEP